MEATTAAMAAMAATAATVAAAATSDRRGQRECAHAGAAVISDPVIGDRSSSQYCIATFGVSDVKWNLQSSNDGAENRGFALFEKP
jgi:hypothetical protein